MAHLRTDWVKKETELQAVLLFGQGDDFEPLPSSSWLPSAKNKPQYRLCDLLPDVLDSVANLMAGPQRGRIAVALETQNTSEPLHLLVAADSPVKPYAVEALEQMCMLMQQRCRLEVDQSTRKRFEFLFQRTALKLNWRRICKLLQSSMGIWSRLHLQHESVKSQWLAIANIITRMEKRSLNKRSLSDEEWVWLWWSLNRVKMLDAALFAGISAGQSHYVHVAWARSSRFDVLNMLSELGSIVTDITFLLDAFNLPQSRYISTRQFKITAVESHDPNAFSLPTTAKEWKCVLGNALEEYNRRRSPTKQKVPVEHIIRRTIARRLSSPSPPPATYVQAPVKLIQYVLENTGTGTTSNPIPVVTQIGMSSPCCAMCEHFATEVFAVTHSGFVLLDKGASQCHSWRFPALAAGTVKEKLLEKMYAGVCEDAMESSKCFEDIAVDDVVYPRSGGIMVGGII